MSYGPDLGGVSSNRRLYRQHPQVRQPADLPVLRSTKFEFIVNLTTSKALGLTIPASFLSLADELIE